MRTWSCAIAMVLMLLMGSCAGDSGYLAALDEALEIVQQHSINRNRLDWGSIEQELGQRAGTVRTEAELYDALQDILDRLDDGHSFLRTAEGRRWRTAESGTVDTDPKPTAWPEPTIIHIDVTTMSSAAGNDMSAYADRLYLEIMQAYRPDMSGWILDLRRNTGGQLWPMLAGLSPLIDSDPAGQAAYPEGIRWQWWAKGGKAGVGDNLHHSVTTTTKLTPARKPIAILIGGATASSGEASVISFIGMNNVRLFGTRTRGLATVNQPFTLSCGATIMLTTAHFADRRGCSYPEGIEPDVTVAAPVDQSDDPCLDAAVEWLLETSR